MRFTDGLSLVLLRSRMAKEIAQKTDSGMTILKNIDWRTAQDICEETRTASDPISIACYNSKTQVSISGTDSALRRMEQAILSLGRDIQVIHLVGSAPFHEALMKEASDELHWALRQCEIIKPEIPVIANVTAKPYETADDIVDGLTRQLYHAVYWEQTIEYLLSHRIEVLIDIGPQNILKNMLAEAQTPVRVYAFDEKLDRQRLYDAFAKQTEADGILYGKVIDLCLMHAATLRNYQPGSRPMDDAREHYYEVARANERIKKRKVAADRALANRALLMLSKTFQAKAVPSDEQEKRRREIMDACHIAQDMFRLEKDNKVVEIIES
jgi:[acyl-carrier-protein] S-malonyltransferase